MRRIFSEFVAGRSLTAIARGLQRDGIPTIRGHHWRQSTVTGIVRNPRYAGMVSHHGEVFDGHHDAIIDGGTWQRTAGLLAARPAKGRGRPPKGRHLFRGGLLRCECGEAVVCRTRGSYELYSCNGRAKFGSDFCAMKSIRRAEVDGAVYRYFEQVGLDLEATRRQLASERDRKLAEIGALLYQAQQEAQRAEERLARIKRDYVDGTLSAADWAAFRDELSAEHLAAQAEVSRLADSEAEVARAGTLLDAEQEVLALLRDIRTTIAGEVTEPWGRARRSRVSRSAA